MSFIATFLVTVIALLTVIVAMSVGVIFGRRAISGSCGGLNRAGGCALCSGTCPKRKAHAAKHQE